MEPRLFVTLRDEYHGPASREAVQKLAQSSFLIEEFLEHLRESGKLSLKPASTGRTLLLHGHCHQKLISHWRLKPPSAKVRVASNWLK